MSPQIVTVIPVYNGEPFIIETLQSLAKQTLQPSRVIVVDGGSKDNTERVVKDFQAIQCEWATENRRQGAFGGMNAALEFCRRGGVFPNPARGRLDRAAVLRGDGQATGKLQRSRHGLLLGRAH